MTEHEEYLQGVLDADPRMRQSLREMVGLENPDPSDALHAALMDALLALPPGASFGQRVVALRWVFNWALRDAGSEFAESKTKHEAHLTRQKVLHLAEPKMSVAKAEILAEGSEGAFELKLRYLLAEQRERAMRKFLDTLDAALDNHRTDRADLRAGDRAAAQGFGGGA